MLVYVPQLTSRCQYTLEWIFTDTWGLPLELTTDQVAFEAYGGDKLCYSPVNTGEGLFIASCGLLFSGQLGLQQPEVFLYQGIPALFPLPNPSADLPFDVFAAVFFMISRYEEYLPAAKDMHGRYSSRESLAYHHDFLLKPVVNYWLKFLKETILKHYPGLALKDPTFRVIFTYDIDTAFAFRGRDLLRQFASSAKDMAALDLDRLKQRIQVLSGMTRDPSDTYDYLMGSWGTVPAEIIFFILSGSYGRFDKNLSLDSRVMKQLVGHLEHHARIGLHPSYRSGDNYYRISKEKKRLESLVGRPIHISRQHYLRFRLPDTYRVLLQAGLTAEYSMGYADLPGFRAGTSLPFYFYDLGLEKKTSLQIFPITFMEGSLKDYMKLSPDQAWPVVSGLIAEVKHSGGVFMSLWHNDSLSDTGTWKGWRELHDRMIRQINSIL